ncbi:hypothetical protein MTR67_039041 [Solanum verrucosum]|uniref:Tf2-1-like SH3-like domain-containing protein n=1 Tax=Solanum verrucosum TaxID=315347 RepID=A0AAF0UHK7_SOLVR|nr:hypothetical protein MTR67_039041 [Solanum verrucosum]
MDCGSSPWIGHPIRPKGPQTTTWTDGPSMDPRSVDRGWFEVGEVALIGPELVHEVMEKVHLIRERLKTAQSRQKSYADVRRRDLEFDVDDWVYLKISPMNGVMRFRKKKKLSPHYVGTYKIFRRICKVAYALDFPNVLALVHLVFYFSLLNKCVG